MDPRLQRRVQRYGWDLAADEYEPLWQAPLAPALHELLAMADLQPGQQVLDVACGSGLAALAAARAVGPQGQVTGIDLSGRMVDLARKRAVDAGLLNTRFERMDAERPDLPAQPFDRALCSLGLMYMPEPEQAVQAMAQALRPGGRLTLSVWGERARCAWSPVFPIVDAEVSSEVCPLFFRLGQGDCLADLCTQAGLRVQALRRLRVTLDHADADQACRAALVGGPVALAWSRFSEAVRSRVRQQYRQAIEPWRQGTAYRLPAEFVIVSANRD